jgi:vancomycin permeability regulator SanA
MTKRWKKIALAIALFVVLVVCACNAAVLHAGWKGIRTQETVPSSDVILVLGGGIREDGSPSDMLEDRLATALALYEDGRAPRVLVTGNHDETTVMRRWLVARDVPRDNLLVDDEGLDTYSSMWRGHRVLGVERAIVVTQRFHLPRAVFLAARNGIDATGVIADRRPYGGDLAWLQVREVVSRTKAWLDVARGRTPRFTGPI